jgi:hypothetical protein
VPRKGAGDTLIDDGEVAPTPTVPHLEEAPPDDVPGGTLLMSGQAPAQPRKAPIRSADTRPEVPDADGPGATQFLGTAPQRGQRKTPPRPVNPGAPTNIMTPEESEAAQQEALAKMEEAKHALVRTRTRADKRGELKALQNTRGMWLALGIGGLVAVAGVVALLLFLLADDSATAPRRHRPTAVPVEQTQVAPDPSTAK